MPFILAELKTKEAAENFLRGAKEEGYSGLQIIEQESGVWGIRTEGQYTEKQKQIIEANTRSHGKPTAKRK